MPEHDAAEFRPAPERAPSATWVAATVAVCAVAAAGAWWFWQRQAEPPLAAPPPAVSAPPVAAAPAPTASGPQNPVEALAPADATLPALAESDGRVTALLNELLGPGQVAAFLQTEGFIRRAVATVDNLGRAQAPARMWPVQSLRDRFLVDGPGEAPAPIATANAARYRAALAFAEAVPLDAAVALYARLYPLFQQAYEELGFPRRYFNDRLVAVLDHLLQAPEPRGPVRVKLLPVNTELADPRPWVRYEFEDPALQALSSGQKILVRMGPENEARAKALIRELRKRVATRDLPPRPQR